VNEVGEQDTTARPNWKTTFNFLFRTDQGTISADVWWRGTIALAGALLFLHFVWEAISSQPRESLSERGGLFDPLVFATYFYLTFYGIMIILIAVSHYNLSAKRWRTCGKAPALAGLWPLSALVAGAAHWLQPRMADVIAPWTVGALDLVFGAIAIWNIYQLGIAGRDE
jgi:hypothetical protein